MWQNSQQSQQQQPQYHPLVHPHHPHPQQEQQQQQQQQLSPSIARLSRSPTSPSIGSPLPLSHQFHQILPEAGLRRRFPRDHSASVTSALTTQPADSLLAGSSGQQQSRFIPISVAIDTGVTNAQAVQRVHQSPDSLRPHLVTSSIWQTHRFVQPATETCQRELAAEVAKGVSDVPVSHHHSLNSARSPCLYPRLASFGLRCRGRDT
ncbi:unnamed protein product [Protopolystoma xenopodis]|uniref:Uncharacterized protein n=1 Tax=Protopolystoma xenopodis TaxID=117903 RepID=A0A3S5B0U6_9PLAT|nr:unnamed protein product [Protopolystoma xenopodis]